MSGSTNIDETQLVLPTFHHHHHKTHLGHGHLAPRHLRHKDWLGGRLARWLEDTIDTDTIEGRSEDKEDKKILQKVDEDVTLDIYDTLHKPRRAPREIIVVPMTTTLNYCALNHPRRFNTHDNTLTGQTVVEGKLQCNHDDTTLHTLMIKHAIKHTHLVWVELFPDHARVS